MHEIDKPQIDGQKKQKEDQEKPKLDLTTRQKTLILTYLEISELQQYLPEPELSEVRELLRRERERLGKKIMMDDMYYTYELYDGDIDDHLKDSLKRRAVPRDPDQITLPKNLVTKSPTSSDHRGNVFDSSDFSEED